MPAKASTPTPKFFAKPADFRRWLLRHHEDTTELWVGFYKKATGKPTITYAEAVDEALCFGWIDGIRKSLGDDAYTNRFTPRRRGSNWSRINIGRVEELSAEGRMHPAGERAFAARTDEKSGVYSFEQSREGAAFPPAYEKQLRKHKAAWTFFSAQPPGYRRLMTWWVISAKQEATRQRRLERLIAESAEHRRVE